MFAAIFFSTFYILYYKGGDTTAYFDGAIALNNLFLDSPEAYFNELFTTPEWSRFHDVYNARIGYPPSWIYREPEAFFVCKIMSLFSFFTLKSYYASTIVMSFIASLVSWKLFLLVRKFKFTKDKFLAWGILFMPSLNFWCSGISKDTIIMIAVFMVVVGIFKLITFTKEFSILTAIGLVINLWMIFHIREFILFALAGPFMLSLSSRLVKIFGGGDYIVILFRSVIVVVGMVILGNSILLQNEENILKQNKYIQEAALTQLDFQQNKTYGDNRYEIGSIEFTPGGLVKIAPAAVLAGVYRPFPWEATKLTLILNGIESLFFLIFTVRFFRRDFRTKWKKIRSHEFLIFALFFTLFMAYVTGLTSGLFGVLVRLRALVLPFFFIIIVFTLEKHDFEWKLNKKKKKEEFS
jgi:hypothetical protein